MRYLVGRHVAKITRFWIKQEFEKFTPMSGLIKVLTLFIHSQKMLEICVIYFPQVIFVSKDIDRI